jgi:hypothetical protein
VPDFFQIVTALSIIIAAGVSANNAPAYKPAPYNPSPYSPAPYKAPAYKADEYDVVSIHEIDLVPSVTY